MVRPGMAANELTSCFRASERKRERERLDSGAIQRTDVS